MRPTRILFHEPRGSRSALHYLQFLVFAFVRGMRMRGVAAFWADDMYAAPVVLALRMFRRRPIVFQDVRELYLPQELPRGKWRLLNRLEGALSQRAEVVLCANQFRASYMYAHLRLKERPIVLENIRDFGAVPSVECPHLDRYLTGRRKVISTGGWTASRRTDDLVSAFGSLGEDYSLIVTGGGSAADRRMLEALIHGSRGEVHLLDKLSPHEMRYLIERSDVGIVAYHRRDLNNEYCASGKVFEYLSLGTPIVTTENPPLFQFCRDHGVGAADDQFINGITEVFENLSQYRASVQDWNAQGGCRSTLDLIAAEVGSRLSARGHCTRAC